jgi:hypothetical protein
MGVTESSQGSLVEMDHRRANGVPAHRPRGGQRQHIGL